MPTNDDYYQDGQNLNLSAKCRNRNHHDYQPMMMITMMIIKGSCNYHHNGDNESKDGCDNVHTADKYDCNSDKDNSKRVTILKIDQDNGKRVTI